MARLVPCLVPGRVDGVGFSCAVSRFSLLVVAALAMTTSAACGNGVEVGIDALDVTLKKTSECTLTGQATRNCTDPAELALTTLRARWIIQTASDEDSVTVTSHDGSTLAGLAFTNDGTILSTPGCEGEGGQCLFARRRLSTSDVNTGCVTFDEIFVVGRFPSDDQRHFIGNLNAVSGGNEFCGTAVTTETISAVDGELVEQPVLALQEAQ